MRNPERLALWHIGGLARPRETRPGPPPTCGVSHVPPQVLGWDFEYIAPCHGEPVSQDGKRILREHLGV